jgi:hypothetical protein
VATLFDGIQPQGSRHVTWDASGVPSGLYFARLAVSGRTRTIRLSLIK